MHMPFKTGITYMLDLDSQSSILPKLHQIIVANFVNVGHILPMPTKG
jgi:hypothetical protein